MTPCRTFTIAFIAYLTTISLVPASVANPPVKTRLIADMFVPVEGFDSLTAAVVAATNRYNPDSVARNREHLGGIITCGQSRYYYTHGIGKSDESPVKFSIAVKPGCELVAFWHTHGGRFDNRRYFSSFDTKAAETAKKPFFMSDYRGALRVFHPGDRVFQNKTMARSITKLPDGAAYGRRVRDESGNMIWVARR